MSAGTGQRKLAAILLTEMVSYSALSQRNEALRWNCSKNIGASCAASFPCSQVAWVKFSLAAAWRAG